ncbi:MAG: hypothetical protein K8S87_10145 [Planctomycetes bacterium]|nr:hypothetical protein [Planctomycetota bacterium]
MAEEKDIQSIKAFLVRHDDPELVTQTIASVVLKNTKISPMNLHRSIANWRRKYFSGGEENLLEALISSSLVSEKHQETIYNVVLYILKRMEDKVFGRRAVYLGFITRDQLNEALAYQKKLYQGLKEIKRVERILRDEELITAKQALSIWKDFQNYMNLRRSRGNRSSPASVKTAFLTIHQEISAEYKEFLKKNEKTFDNIEEKIASNQKQTENMTKDDMGESLLMFSDSDEIEPGID